MTERPPCNWPKCRSPQTGKCFAWCKCVCHQWQAKIPCWPESAPCGACPDCALPEEAGEAAEVEIDFVPDEFGIRVTAVFGNSSVVVEHAWESAEEAATLIQALPNIMIAVQEALDAQEEIRG